MQRGAPGVRWDFRNRRTITLAPSIHELERILKGAYNLDPTTPTLQSSPSVQDCNISNKYVEAQEL